jgi:hypothetical protein
MAWPSKVEHKDHKVTKKQFLESLAKLAAAGAVVGSRGLLLPLVEMPSSAGYPEDVGDALPGITPMSPAEARKLAADKLRKRNASK